MGMMGGAFNRRKVKPHKQEKKKRDRSRAAGKRVPIVVVRNSKELGLAGVSKKKARIMRKRANELKKTLEPLARSGATMSDDSLPVLTMTQSIQTKQKTAPKQQAQNLNVVEEQKVADTGMTDASANTATSSRRSKRGAQAKAAPAAAAAMETAPMVAEDLDMIAVTPTGTSRTRSKSKSKSNAKAKPQATSRTRSKGKAKGKASAAGPAAMQLE